MTKESELTRAQRRNVQHISHKENGTGRKEETGSIERNGERILIAAPLGQDATAMAELLSAEGFATDICVDAAECARKIGTGAGLVIMTEEALETTQLPSLFQTLQTQPPWSQLPLIILTSGGESRRAKLLDLTAAAAGTVTLLERPMSTLTLVRSVQVALASRRRQFETRDLVRQLDGLNQTLEQRVAHRTAEAIKRAQQLRLLTAELSMAEEAERQRIAQVLHDDLQQGLMAARLYLGVLRDSTSATKRHKVTQEIEQMLKRSFDLTRSLSVEIAPPILHENGLAAALEWLVARAQKDYRVKITVETDPSTNPKAADIRVFLFRAARELVFNAVKHAHGSPIHVEMSRVKSNKFRILVSDQGPGFDPTILDPRQVGSSGLGLFNIRERLTKLGGTFHLESAPGRGTRIALLAPCNPVPKVTHRRKRLAI